MDATIHPFRCTPETEPSDVVRALRPSGGQVGAIVLGPLEGADGLVVVFGAAPSPTAAYRVVDRFEGSAAGRRPLFAQVTWLNGAGSPAVAAAAERGGRERIEPAVRDIEGLVGAFVLQSPHHRIVTVTLTTALETVAAVDEAIMATELLPGEDPELLPGPDRIELTRVLLAELPVEVRS